MSEADISFDELCSAAPECKAEEAEETEGGSWPEPGHLPGGPPGDIEHTGVDHFPEPIQDFIGGESAALFTDPLAFGAVAMCGASLLVARGFDVVVPWGDWNQTPNMSGFVSAPPGAGKSPIVRKALAPILELQDTFDEEHRQAMDAYAEVVRGGDGKDLPPPPVRKLVVTNDATTEAIQSRLGEQEQAGLPTGLLLYADELGAQFQKWSRKEGDRLYMTSAMDGGQVVRGHRQTRDFVSCGRLTVSVAGGIQTGLTAAAVGGATSGEGADGLIQRFQCAVAPTLYRKKKTPPKPYSARKKYASAFEAIIGIEGIDPSRVDAGYPLLRFTDDAAARFQEWYSSHDLELSQGKFGDGPFAQHQAKAGALVASWAATDHMVRVSARMTRGRIGDVSVARAIAVHRRLMEHAAGIYGWTPGASTLSPAAWRIVTAYRRGDLKGDTCTGAIRNKRWADLPDAGAIMDACGELESLNLIRLTRRSGRSYDIEINPKWIARSFR